MDIPDAASNEPPKDKEKQEIEVLQPDNEISTSTAEAKGQRSKDNVKGGARPKERQTTNRPKTTEQNREKQSLSKHNNGNKTSYGRQNYNRREYQKTHFEPYLSQEKLQEGLKQGRLIQGPLKINQKNNREGYVPHPDGMSDVFVDGIKHRNRALNGDIVVVELFDRTYWNVNEGNLQTLKTDLCEQLKLCQITTPNEHKKTDLIVQQNKEGNKSKDRRNFRPLHQVLKDGDDWMKTLFKSDNEEISKSAKRLLMRTGKIVAIIEAKHSRVFIGSLIKDENSDKAQFEPHDKRFTRIMVPMNSCPKDFLQSPENYANTLFIWKIKDWRENSKFPDGEFMGSLGEVGEIEPETKAILIENDVDYSEFTDDMLSSISEQQLPWSIPEEEFAKRRDFRQDCVFTIDPATARDLDDAVSCEKLEDGTYNVGVHIADVSYFLKEGTELDKRARLRATSVYLVQKVIPMLPNRLCEELCSLNPSQDKLTFSVVWNMSEKGKINDTWFGRSIIRSCVKLSYDHAQGFIEDPEREWTKEELPEVTGGFPINQIRDTVLHLQKIARNLRQNRFDKGALRLDKVKIQYTLHEDTDMPTGYNIQEQRDSNRLIEEFMLLANMSVAHHLRKHFPEKAFLRRHPPPQDKMINNLIEQCSNLGFPIEADSSGSLQRSLLKYEDPDEISVSRMQVLVNMCCKAMQQAKYFCTGCLADEELYRHYALNVPLYTHFTSPIRRYADVMVHRMLAASLDYNTITDMNNEQIQRIADNCNDRKTNAKQASELSAELYFAVFVKKAGPLEEQGMVMGVLDKAFDVLFYKCGVIKRVYCDKLELNKLDYKKEKNPVLTLYWEPPEGQTSGPVQKISIFTVVTCILKQGDRPLQWVAIIKRPKE